MKKRLVVNVGLIVAGLIVVAGCANREQSGGERKIAVKAADLPEKIEKAIREVFPNGEIVEIEKEVEGEDPGQYDFVVRSAGKTYEVEVSPEGKVIETKEVASRAAAGPSDGKPWKDDFDLSARTLVTTGKSRYLILEPGFQIVLEGEDERVQITVLDETVKVGSVTARVVEEREWADGKLVEVSRNFFAMCEKTKDVFYFGEDVEIYKDGKPVKAKDAWRAYRDGAKPGLIMPGQPAVGQKYYQEIAPGVAMDRAEVVSVTERLKTPAGTFTDCLKTLETNPLKPRERDYKTYAPGIGMIQDEDLLLVRHGRR